MSQADNLEQDSLSTLLENDFSSLMTSIKLSDSQSFYGCLLVSQLETVDAVSRLDKQVINVANKNILLENLLYLTIDKCNALEESLRLFCNQFESLSLNQQASEPPSSPLKALVEICSELHEKENKPSTTLAQSTQTDQNTIKEEDDDETSVKKEFCSVEHTACFYCLSHSQMHADQKPPALLAEHKCEEYKEIQRQFNKRVKYEVNKKFGSYYLAEHQVRELDVKEMHRIRKKVVKLFSPFPLPVKLAWNNAMNSLRQDRHQLKKKRRYLKK